LIATAFITLGAQLLMRETKGIVLDAISEEPAREPGSQTTAQNTR
jgi:hypothetical protein